MTILYPTSYASASLRYLSRFALVVAMSLDITAACEARPSFSHCTYAGERFRQLHVLGWRGVIA